MNGWWVDPSLHVQLNKCWITINLSGRHIRAHSSWPQASPYCHQCWHLQLKGRCMTVACFHIDKGALTWSAFSGLTIQSWKQPSDCTFCRSVWDTCSVWLQNQGWPTTFLNFLFWSPKAEWLPDFPYTAGYPAFPAIHRGPQESLLEVGTRLPLVQLFLHCGGHHGHQAGLQEVHPEGGFHVQTVTQHNVDYIKDPSAMKK